MGLLPVDFYSGTAKSTLFLKNSNSEPPLLKDYSIDFNTGYLIKSNSGQFTIVTGLEALIVQIWRKLHTQQGVYEIFSKKYGNTFEELIGKGKSYSDAYIYKTLSDAILDNVYVKKIENVKISFSNDTYTIYFTLNTIYGNTAQSLNIDLGELGE